MKITMLGTGAALPDPERGQTAILLSLESGRHYLFDCGEGATRQMVRANVNPAEVGLVFLTHLHHDHISDFPNFVISGWLLNRQGRPRVLGPRGTRRFVRHLFEDGAFDADFQARSSLQARRNNIDAVRPDVIEIATTNCASLRRMSNICPTTFANASACASKPKARWSRSAETRSRARPWKSWRAAPTC